MNRVTLRTVRNGGALVLVLLLSTAAGAISFSGVDAQTQYTGYSSPPGIETPGLLTFYDTLNGSNPTPAPGRVTQSDDIAALLNGKVSLELQLDTTSYDPATGKATDATFVGTGGSEITIWDETYTTVLLIFDVSFVDARSANGLGVSNVVQLGDPEGSLTPSNASLTVAGGSLAGLVGGIGTLATLDLIINDPDPPLSDLSGDLIAGYPGFWNDSFTSGTASGSNPTAGVTWAITIIPEPATGGLLALGLIGLAARRRARRRV